MIDLTPLDVRNKRGDFKRGLRGYDSEEVDGFIELVAERLEELVRENLKLKERTDRLEEQVRSQEGREKAVNDALVTAQQLREEIQGEARSQADRLLENAKAEAAALLDRARADADAVSREAKQASERSQAEARRSLREAREALETLDRSRSRFLKGFRSLLEREMDLVEVEEGRGSYAIPSLPMELDDGPDRAPDREETSSRRGEDEGAEEVSAELDAAEPDEEPAVAVEEDAEEEVHIRDLAPPTAGAWDASFLLDDSKDEAVQNEGADQEDAGPGAGEAPQEEKRWIWTPPPAAMPADPAHDPDAEYDGPQEGLSEEEANPQSEEVQPDEDRGGGTGPGGDEDEGAEDRKPFWRRGHS